MACQRPSTTLFSGVRNVTYALRIVPRRKPQLTVPGGPKKVSQGLKSETSHMRPGSRGLRLGKLSQAALAGIEAISTSATYPKGAILFVEGQPCTGVFLICGGRVKLSTNSADGRSLILQIARKGELLGLSAVISGKSHEVTAEALESIRASFISAGPFKGFLRRNGEAALRVAEILSELHQATYQEVRHLGLARSVAQKLARLLLGLTDEQKPGKAPSRTILKVTHQEIADMIGTSRETV